MKMRLAFILFMLFTAVAANAQGFAIAGTITDSATGKPVAAASVFLSNTSIGTTSNNSGEFTLNRVPQGRFDLIVSCLGYATFAQKIVPGTQVVRLAIKLNPSANDLANVTVSAYDKNGWEKWGKMFTSNFIGTSYLAAGCTIKNPDVIKFHYSAKKDVLQAHSDEAIVIENDALGYIIHYKLEEFVYDFPASSISYEGFPLFQEMDGNARKQKRWQERRKDAYYGSIMHFMRCLYVNKLADNGYELRKLEKKPNLEKKRIQALYKYFISPDRSEDDFEASLPADTLKYFKHVLGQPNETQILHNELIPADSIAAAADSVTAELAFNDYLYVTYKNKKTPYEYLQQTYQSQNNSTQMQGANSEGFQTSQISLTNQRPVYVLYNGMYYQPLDMLTIGYWGWSDKVGDMLPFDYWP